MIVVMRNNVRCCGSGFLIPILSHAQVAIPITIPVPGLQHTQTHPHMIPRKNIRKMNPHSRCRPLLHTGKQGCLSCWILTERCLKHVAHVHFCHFFLLDTFNTTSLYSLRSRSSSSYLPQNTLLWTMPGSWKKLQPLRQSVCLSAVRTFICSVPSIAKNRKSHKDLICHVVFSTQNYH